MIGSARTANFDTHSYLKLKRKFLCQDKYQRLYVKSILRLVFFHLAVIIKVELSELEPSRVLHR